MRENTLAIVCNGKANAISNADNLVTTKQFIPSISITPNPATDIIFINGLSKTSTSTISIVDLQGKLLKTTGYAFSYMPIKYKCNGKRNLSFTNSGWK